MNSSYNGVESFATMYLDALKGLNDWKAHRIDWGDGVITNLTGHTYMSVGIYNVSISKDISVENEPIKKGK